MIKVDEMLPTTAKIAPNNRKRDKKKKASRRKEPIRNLTNSIINAMMKDLIRKIKILTL